jgi:DNA-binding transcriptional ArsR family regulator
LRLLSLIASVRGGEACVCDLTDAFQLTGPTISHHLRAGAGVQSGRAARWRWRNRRSASYGLDLTEEMLALALENARKAGAVNVEFRKARSRRFPLPANAVDVITCNWSCHWSPARAPTVVAAEAGRPVDRQVARGCALPHSPGRTVPQGRVGNDDQ